MKREVILTRDGTHTLAIPEKKVMYHSIHGARSESMHVYIQAGLWQAFATFPNETLYVFEMGFGTGLNALLTAIEARKKQRHVHFTSIETNPLAIEEVSHLQYGKELAAEALFQQLHQVEWQYPASIHSYFTLQKEEANLFNYSTKQTFHVIYYDAFAPSAQPELWTEEVFAKLYALLVPEGFLVTYCAKGVVKRAMHAAGFTVSHLPGPPRKREMLMAKKSGPLPPEGGT